MANLVRFSSSVPSFVAKDTRGWLLDPISLARASGILGGALTCASVHIGEIRPGRLRGNHRHHDCNETFVLWGALIKFRDVWCGPGIGFASDHASASVNCVVARKNASSRRSLDAVERATHREKSSEQLVKNLVMAWV
ncbi:uncharacterized protein LOC107623152 isoform X1 [Arachis ipaensis]|uniref:uncharacterized protein LOC107623152 isoform X1 n=1 Tax=Arachis ipaensis TaxID=130454 RepID=UPI000A2B4F3B|nr:uncharacterized protein LOC107623152 isoform X1 [Arachis ipaensis]